MKNHNDMSLEECRDAMAEHRGYILIGTNREDHWTLYTAPTSVVPHPIPATLDAIVGCMPEGWWWSRFETPSEGVKWVAGPNRGLFAVALYDTGNELLDRARLAIACHRATTPQEPRA